MQYTIFLLKLYFNILLTLKKLNSVYFRTGINELRNLQYLPRFSEAREHLFEDRTKAHADHVGHGLDRKTTAAVGILKAIHAGKKDHDSNRVTKDVIAFSAKDFDILSEKLQLDLHEPPSSQVYIGTFTKIG